jgi:hypothetical protein
MAPSTIMLIRHAEKPGQAWPGPGLTEAGATDPAGLVIRGWQRAGALARLFAEPPPPLLRPQRIFASHPDKPDGRRSLRPLQTVEPLAAALGLGADTRYTRGDEADLAAAAVAAGGAVLVSWQHEGLPALAAAIAGGDAGVPQHWPDRCYDRIWLLARAEESAPWSFRVLAQSVLAGDAAAP